jgi:hypothetical protein
MIKRYKILILVLITFTIFLLWLGMYEEIHSYHKSGQLSYLFNLKMRVTNRNLYTGIYRLGVFFIIITYLLISVKSIIRKR